MLVAKELKYQIYRYALRQNEAYNDQYIEKSSSLTLSRGDRVTATFYKAADSYSKDTLFAIGYNWIVDTSITDELVAIEGITDQIFRHVEDGYPIYINLLLDDANFSYINFNDSIYTNGEIFPIDLLNYGGNINRIK